MRKLLFLMLMAGAVGLQSCQKEVDGSLDNGNSAVTGDFKAKIEGNQWVANSVAGASRMSGFINITGRSNDKKILTITLTDSAVHNYTLDDNSFNVAAFIDSTLPNPMAFTTNQGVNPGDAGGTVNITSIDVANKKISGTFSFKVYRQLDGLSRNFTEGSFTNLSYTTTLPPPSSSDTFRVKIGGTSWSYNSLIGVMSPAVPPLLPAKIGITANNTSTSQTVGIVMPADIVPGTYTTDFLAGNYIVQYNPDTDPMHSQASMSGTLTILSHNTSTRRIRGNFTCRTEELLNPLMFSNLTEGYFAITY